VRFYPGGKFAQMLKGMAVTGAAEALDVEEEGQQTTDN
jgi:hypothetical protein